MKQTTIILAFTLCFALSSEVHSQQVENAELKAERQFQNLLDTDWQRTMDLWPVFSNYLGMGNDDRNKRWTNMSLQAYSDKQLGDKNVLAALAKIDRNALNEASQLNFDLFLWQYYYSRTGFGLQNWSAKIVGTARKGGKAIR